jgi:hypothetical protein
MRAVSSLLSFTVRTIWGAVAYLRETRHYAEAPTERN